MQRALFAWIMGAFFSWVACSPLFFVRGFGSSWYQTPLLCGCGLAVHFLYLRFSISLDHCIWGLSMLKF